MNLVEINNKSIVVSSITVAEHFEKEHFHILRDINNLLGCIQNLIDPQAMNKMFTKTTYVNEQNNQEYPMYLMNRDGFSLLAMGFTGAKALEWKIKYIEAFNDMEQILTKQLLAQPKEKIKELRRKLEWNRTARSNADERYNEAQNELSQQLNKYNNLVDMYNHNMDMLDIFKQEVNRSHIALDYIDTMIIKNGKCTRDDLETIKVFIKNTMS